MIKRKKSVVIPIHCLGDHVLCSVDQIHNFSGVSHFAGEIPLQGTYWVSEIRIKLDTNNLNW